MGKFTLSCVSTTIVVGVDAMVGLVWLCDTLDTDVLNCTEFCLNSSCGEKEKNARKYVSYNYIKMVPCASCGSWTLTQFFFINNYIH